MELESIPTPQERPSALSPKTRRTTFCFPCCFGSRRSTWWERVRSTSQPHPTALTGDRWWWRGLWALKKLREWSEIVAGPRWKTFIRRFNRNRGKAKYQYDPLSYALNFDEGQNGDFQDDGLDGFRNFSTRYAVAVPVSVNVKSVSAEGKDVAVLV